MLRLRAAVNSASVQAAQSASPMKTNANSGHETVVSPVAAAVSPVVILAGGESRARRARPDATATEAQMIRILIPRIAVPLMFTVSFDQRVRSYFFKQRERWGHQECPRHWRCFHNDCTREVEHSALQQRRVLKWRPTPKLHQDTRFARPIDGRDRVVVSLLRSLRSNPHASYRFILLSNESRNLTFPLLLAIERIDKEIAERLRRESDQATSG